MKMKYDIEIKESSLDFNLTKIMNLTYKLLPYREEGMNWEEPLSTIIEEFAGMDRILYEEDKFFCVLCKLEGLYTLKSESDFRFYRKTIFECINLIGEIKDKVKSCQ